MNKTQNAPRISVVPLGHYATMIACGEFRVMVGYAKL